MLRKFNVRVYGIWERAGKILVSEEVIGSVRMLKFPGGGVELGEGPTEALQREFMEELGLERIGYTHLHTMEGFVQSRFRPEEQVITIHYEVESEEEPRSMERIQPTKLGAQNQLRFNWEEPNASLMERLSFEADKEAFEKWLSRRD